MPGGGKVIRPLVLENRRWMQKGISRPLPLYNLPGLLERPDAPVLVVEGEKTSDAAGRALPVPHCHHVHVRGEITPPKRLDAP